MAGTYYTRRGNCQNSQQKVLRRRRSVLLDRVAVTFCSNTYQVRDMAVLRVTAHAGNHGA